MLGESPTPRVSIWERFPELREIPQGGYPQHILIIPDGNRRWANAHKLQAALGHKSGMGKTLELMRDLDELPIRVITFWAFSSDNWQRPREETGAIMSMLERGLKENLAELQQKNIRLRRIGRTDRIPPSLAKTLEETIQKTSGNTGKIVNLAIDFAGDDQELRMAEKLRDLVLKSPGLTITKTLLDSLKDGEGLIPPADLIIRTSGEKRTSGIGWLNGKQTELEFPEKLYPDIDSSDIVNAIIAFSRKQRRMGT